MKRHVACDIPLTDSMTKTTQNEDWPSMAKIKLLTWAVSGSDIFNFGHCFKGMDVFCPSPLSVGQV